MDREPDSMPKLQELDWRLLDLLLSAVKHRPWAICELVAVFGNEDAVGEALGRLRRVELIMRISVYVVPSCAAVAYRELAERYPSQPAN